VLDGGVSDSNKRSLALIIGVGNEYRHDGVELKWPVLATQLRKSGVLRIPAKEPVWSIREADLVIIIDAAQSQSSPGAVLFFDAGNSPIPGDFFNYSTHAFSVAEAVELARALDKLPTTSFWFEGTDFSAGID
jgi:hydrogenase maturation protease